MLEMQKANGVLRSEPLPSKASVQAWYLPLMPQQSVQLAATIAAEASLPVQVFAQ
jgi:hypothetical protein